MKPKNILKTIPAEEAPEGAVRKLIGTVVHFISLVSAAANKRVFIAKTAHPEQETNFNKFVPIQKIDDEKRRVYGVVYMPDETDTDGEYMDSETVENMAFDFIRAGRSTNVDKDHNFVAGEGFVAESWMVRKGDPMFPDEKEGSWVVGIQITNEETWGLIKDGTLTGLSLGGYAATEEVATKLKESDTLGAYKLPHHKLVDSTLKVSLRGVQATMALINNASDGVDIPSDELKSVYNYLAEYSKQSGQGSPEFKGSTTKKEVGLLKRLMFLPKGTSKGDVTQMLEGEERHEMIKGLVAKADPQYDLDATISLIEVETYLGDILWAYWEIVYRILESGELTLEEKRTALTTCGNQLLLILQEILIVVHEQNKSTWKGILSKGLTSLSEVNSMSEKETVTLTKEELEAKLVAAKAEGVAEKEAEEAKKVEEAKKAEEAEKEAALKEKQIADGKLKESDNEGLQKIKDSLEAVNATLKEVTVSFATVDVTLKDMVERVKVLEDLRGIAQKGVKDNGKSDDDKPIYVERPIGASFKERLKGKKAS